MHVGSIATPDFQKVVAIHPSAQIQGDLNGYVTNLVHFKWEVT